MDGLVVLLYLRDVAAVVDDGDLAAGDAVGELAGVGDVGELVLAAPDDQGAGADPVQPVAQAPVWDRPGELAGAAERPDQAGDGGPLPFAVGCSSSHNPIGSSTTSAESRSGKWAASSQASMPPNDWPTTTGVTSPSLRTSSS